MNKPAPWLKGIEGKTAHELIESKAPVIRVVAGPGSGKTTCLRRRIQRLIQGDGIDPEKIYIGTFTRAIASELNQELGSDVKVSTLHSLAYQLLRENPEACQGMHLRFLLNFEQDVMLYDIESVASAFGNIHGRRKELLRLQASKSQRAEYHQAAFDAAVRRWLRKHRAMLIGEVVFLCVEGLESEDIHSGFVDHVVIDEYQDLTVVEQELVERVWSGTGSLTVMGDDDQSIYGFRFNHPDGISSFYEAWKDRGCKDLTFSENWRCGNEILRTANLMKAKTGSRKPCMIARSGRQGKQHLVHWNSIDDEVEGLARYINACPKESFLVLVPRRFIGYRIAENIGSDARTMFTEEVLEHPVAQEAFSAFSLLADPDDWVSVRTWLGFHGNNCKHASQRNATAYDSLPSELGGHELIRRIAIGDVSLSGAGKSHVEERSKRAGELINRNLEPEAAIDFLFREELGQLESDVEKRGWLIEDLNELRGAAHHLLAGQDNPDLVSVINTMRYRIATRAPLRSDVEEPRVKIMTLHSAKGLEADNVIIAGVPDQFMPGIETDINKTNEQERLLYVAITRARDSLIISWPRRISVEDLKTNMGRVSDQVTTIHGVRWSVTTRSTLLPKGLSGVIRGEKLLEGRCCES